MPSFPYAPAALALAGGEFNVEPIRFGFTPAALSLIGGSVAAGPSLTAGITDTLNAILDTLYASEAIVDDQGRPTRRFQQLWENAIGGLKQALASQGASISELQRIYAGINAAQSTATEGVQQAQAVTSVVALANSYPDPGNVLTADNTATVTIAAHERVYGDSARTRVSVDGGTVTGLSNGLTYTIFYLDAGRQGGAVQYQATTDAVAQTGDTHVIGSVTIPNAGEAATSGTTVGAPGTTTVTGIYRRDTV